MSVRGRSADGLWDGQRRFLEALLNDRHVVSIKSRKVGLTTLVCAHAALGRRGSATSGPVTVTDARSW
jgi:hypothetical protein